MYEFKKLAEVEQVEKIGTSATLLIEEDNEIKRVPKEAVSTEIVEPSGYTVTIEPNKYYWFDEAATLTITLDEPIDGILSEYMFEFVSGTTPTALTVTPASGTLSWVGGEPTIEASKTYQVSILNNVAVIVGA